VISTSPSSLKWAGLLLGFALGGFFDGILLYQILQWHHLLSNVDAVRDMRLQIMFDGLFHALMYVIAFVGVMKLWRARRAVNGPGSGKWLWGNAFLGFGAWHIADSVLSHWVTGIHRIRVDAPNPLAWDLLWFVAFGLAPMVAGLTMVRRNGPQGRDRNGHKAASALGITALLAGSIAAMPSGADPTQRVVLFAPGISTRDAFNALASVDARVLWVDRSGGTWVIKTDAPSNASKLYGRGAMLVSSAVLPMGCLSWTKASKT